MLQRIAFLSLVVALVVFGVAADGKKKPATTSSSTTTVAASTTTISASEGTTAMAIRGIVGTEGPTGIVVIGIAPVDGIVTARNRQSGGTFKFRVPAHSNVHVGDNVIGDLNGSVASIKGLAGRFNVHNALAVVALGEALGLDPVAVRAGLESVDRIPGRIREEEHGCANCAADHKCRKRHQPSLPLEHVDGDVIGSGISRKPSLLTLARHKSEK